MDIAAHVDSVGPAARNSGQRRIDKGDAAGIVIGGNAVFGDDDRLADAAGRHADRRLERFGPVFIAHVGQRGALGIGQGAFHPDQRAGVGLHTHEIGGSGHIEPRAIERIFEGGGAVAFAAPFDLGHRNRNA